jgi:hypothetical protein
VLNSPTGHGAQSTFGVAAEAARPVKARDAKESERKWVVMVVGLKGGSTSVAFMADKT